MNLSWQTVSIKILKQTKYRCNYFFVFKVLTWSQSLAGGASEQVAVVEKSSLSLEEISSMTRQNAPDSKEPALTTEGMNAQAEHCVVLLGNSSLV